jgi:hypothetical protein
MSRMYISLSTSPAADHHRPAFLQPQPQPQMRQPAMSTNWHTNQLDMAYALNPSLFQSHPAQYAPDGSASNQHQGAHEYTGDGKYGYTSYGTQDGYGVQVQHSPYYVQDADGNWIAVNSNEAFSPAPPPHSEVQAYMMPSTSPSVRHPYAAAGYDTGYSSLGLFQSEVGRRTSIPFQEGGYEESLHRDWPDAAHRHSYERLDTLGGHPRTHLPTMHYQGPTPILASSPEDPPQDMPSTWALPLVASNCHETHEEMAPPPSKRRSKTSRQSLGPSTYSPSANHQEEDNKPTAKQRKTRPSTKPRPFIHAICGKSFQTRSDVKKHHWGRSAGAAGDTSTTSGCWARNNKPNREWYAVP